MKKFLLCVLVGVVIGVVLGQRAPVLAAERPAAPTLMTVLAAPEAYPGNKLQWDQPVADAAEAAIIKHTIAWDGNVKADIVTSVCTSYAPPATFITCTMPIPSMTATGNHTVILTAFKVVDGTRYESVNSDPFAFIYVVPSPPPVPAGMRIVK